MNINWLNKKDDQTALHYISFDKGGGEGYPELIHYLYINGGEIDIKDKVLIFIYLFLNLNEYW